VQAWRQAQARVTHAGHDERTRLRLSRISITRSADLARDSAPFGVLCHCHLIPPQARAPGTNVPAVRDPQPGQPRPHTGHGRPVGLGNTIRDALWQSGCDVVLVGESAEDLLPANPELGEVDRFRRAGVGLS
jgi:hypothetical protein